MQIFKEKSNKFLDDLVKPHQNQPITEIIAPAGIKIAPEQVEIGQFKIRTFFILTYPQTINANWLSPVINLDKEMNIALHISPVDTETILKKLAKKTTQIQSQISMREEKGLIRDPILQTGLRNVEDLRDRLQTGQERFFQFGLYVSIIGQDEPELKQTETEIRSLLESQQIYLKPASFQQEQGFNASLPILQDNLSALTPLNTGPLSASFPFSSFDLSSNKGVLYGINQHNNSLIMFDRFSLENANSVVFAKSGAGKSYAIKLEILRSLMQGIEVIAIDPEKEYQYLAESVDGSFVDISLNSPYHLNPFDLAEPKDNERPGDILRSNIINLVGLLRIMLGGLSPEEDALLDKALTETYNSRDINEHSDFTGKEPPLMEDLHNVLKNLQGGQSLALRLEKYVSGSYAGLFNQPTNAKINKRLAVFSIRDMEEELRPIGMYLILHHIWNTVRSQIKKRMLVVDEAWWMMKYEDGASFLFSMAKRARKYYLGLTTITQDVSDFMSSSYGRPIVANSSLQILLKQSPAAIEVVSQTFNLTEQEKYLLLEANVGEGLFFAGLKHVAIKIVASYTEDQIITSDPAQLEEIAQAKQEFAKAESDHE